MAANPRAVDGNRRSPLVAMVQTIGAAAVATVAVEALPLAAAVQDEERVPDAIVMVLANGFDGSAELEPAVPALARLAAIEGTIRSRVLF